MIYDLKECSTGDNACYNTTVEITEKNGAVTFKFVAENTKYYSPYHGYNKVHSLGGDVVEVFIGSDSERINYYEIELSPENELMLAKIRYNGDDSFGKPVLDLDL